MVVRPIITNQRTTPYRLGTSDKIQVKVNLFNGNKQLSRLGIPVELYLNYPSGWIKFAEGTTDRLGSQLLTVSCVNINSIDNCLGYVKAIINRVDYNSNITRFNFFQTKEILNNILEIPDELIIYESQYFDFKDL